MPFKGYTTYYRIAEGATCDKTPLLLLHGGPGSTHNYFELLDGLAETGRQVISYDQLGCGRSYVDGHPELWTLDNWLDELESMAAIVCRRTRSSSWPTTATCRRI